MADEVSFAPVSAISPVRIEGSPQSEKIVRSIRSGIPGDHPERMYPGNVHFFEHMFIYLNKIYLPRTTSLGIMGALIYQGKYDLVRGRDKATSFRGLVRIIQRIFRAKFDFWW